MERDILPPKKLIGNKSETFVEKRRLALENYLNSVYNYLKKIMPRPLAIFLDLHVYEILFLLQNLACRFFTEGVTLLQSSKSFTFDVVQVSSIELVTSIESHPYDSVSFSDLEFHKNDE